MRAKGHFLLLDSCNVCSMTHGDVSDMQYEMCAADFPASWQRFKSILCHQFKAGALAGDRPVGCCVALAEDVLRVLVVLSNVC